MLEYSPVISKAKYKLWLKATNSIEWLWTKARHCDY